MIRFTLKQRFLKQIANCDTIHAKHCTLKQHFLQQNAIMIRLKANSTVQTGRHTRHAIGIDDKNKAFAVGLHRASPTAIARQ